MQKKYYTSQVFNEDSEISEMEALKRGSYVVCYFLGGKPEYAENIEGKNVRHVIHFVQQWPSESAFKKQRSRKDKTTFEFALPPEYIGHKEITKYYYFKAGGEFNFILEYHDDPDNNLLLEIRRDENQNVRGLIEHEYDATGELLFIREYNADGKMVSELDYVDYYA
jgi:hypothetical protein